jgi:hypothetical protein
VIGFVATMDADDMFTAADELAHSLASNPNVSPKVVSVDIAEKQVFCDVTIRCNLKDLMAQIEADCPTLDKNGSASAGQFVRRYGW